MSAKPIQVLVAAGLVCAGSVVTSVLMTTVMDQVSDTLLVGLMASIAGAVLVSLRATGLVTRVRAMQRDSVRMAAVGGVAAFWLAPVLALAQRATDAPSGSETLFFTTTAWGALAVAAWLSAAGVRAGRAALGPAVAAVAGAAALLASWERPSSFSPFSKFPVQEAVMVLAGMVFVAGSAALVVAARDRDVRDLAAIGAGAAGAFGLAVGVFSLPGAGPALVRLATIFVLLGAAQAAFIYGWTRLPAHRNISAAGSLLLITPVLVTGLFFLERATGAFGAMPFQVPGVIAGSAVCTLGTVATWLASGEPVEGGGPAPRGAKVAAGLAWAALATATVSLLRPALSASVEGVLGGGFSARWMMVGGESAAGWLPLAAAAALVTAIGAYRDGRAGRVWSVSILTAVAAIAAMPALWDTTLHTWNRWVPAAVQQTYGTEYARFTVSGVIEPTRIVAAALVLLSIVVFLGTVLVDRPRIQSDDSEVRL